MYMDNQDNPLPASFAMLRVTSHVVKRYTEARVQGGDPHAMLDALKRERFTGTLQVDFTQGVGTAMKFTKKEK